jgi:predicted O-methyltransferase YrrM
MAAPVLYVPGGVGRWRRHLFGVLRLRPPIAEHTAAEGELLRRYAEGARCAVEIGVSEGGSAWELRQVIDAEGTLYLIDPYPPGRLLGIPMARLVARRLVGRVSRGHVEWIEKYSFDAAVDWDEPIDFLFIDANHSFRAVRRDWDDWSPLVRHGGIVALHDARVSDGLWTTPDDGPVRLVEMLKQEAPEWQLVDGADSLAVLRRTG